MKRFLISVLALIMCCSCFVSCGSEGGADDGITVLATNFALYDFARGVCGDVCNVEMLLPPETEAHDYEVSLSDMSRIEKSSLFVCVGGESEDWVEDVAESLGEENLNILRAGECVNLLEEELTEGMEGEADGAADEHVWLSVENAQKISAAIYEAVDALVDEEDRVGLKESYMAYSDELTALESEYSALMSEAKRKTIVVADRFPFRYLADELGLEYYAAFSGCSSNVEPSLAAINTLVTKVKDNGIPVVYIIEFSDGKTAQAVADETGCDILTLQSAHNVTNEQFESGVTYVDLMRENIEVLRRGLCD